MLNSELQFTCYYKTLILGKAMTNSRGKTFGTTQSKLSSSCTGQLADGLPKKDGFKEEANRWRINRTRNEVMRNYEKKQLTRIWSS